MSGFADYVDEAGITRLRATGGGGGGGELPEWTGDDAPTPLPDVFRNGGNVLALGGTSADTEFDGVVAVSDAYAQWNGNGDGLSWRGNGTDGEQVLEVKTGGGTQLGTLQDASGNMTVPGKITVGTDPTTAGDVATKGYVDAVLRSVTVELQPADIATLFTVGFVLTPAPGVGKYLMPIDASFQQKPGATPYSYAGGGALVAPAGASSGPLRVAGQGWITSAVERVGWFDRFDSTSLVVSQFENQPLGLFAEDSDPSAGDGTFTVSLIYRVVDLS